MVSAPAAADAVRRARLLPNLRVGLHVVLADGLASLPPELVPALANQRGEMDARMFVRGVKFFVLPRVRRQLRAEIRAQFSAFARTGLVLDHVNVHKHFHMHPSILNMLLDIGRDFGLQAVRIPDEPAWFAARAGARWSGVSNRLLSPWLALMKRRLSAAKIFHNHALFGIAASGTMDEERLLMILDRLPRGVSEIYLHPATLSGEAVSESMDGYEHAAELAALLSPRVLASAEKLNVARGGYGDAMRVR